jgi:hypothetical protein
MKVEDSLLSSQEHAIYISLSHVIKTTRITKLLLTYMTELIKENLIKWYTFCCHIPDRLFKLFSAITRFYLQFQNSICVSCTEPKVPYVANKLYKENSYCN